MKSKADKIIDWAFAGLMSIMAIFLAIGVPILLITDNDTEEEEQPTDKELYTETVPDEDWFEVTDPGNGVVLRCWRYTGNIHDVMCYKK